MSTSLLEPDTGTAVFLLIYLVLYLNGHQAKYNQIAAELQHVASKANCVMTCVIACLHFCISASLKFCQDFVTGSNYRPLVVNS